MLCCLYFLHIAPDGNNWWMDFCEMLLRPSSFSEDAVWSLTFPRVKLVFLRLAGQNLVQWKIPPYSRLTELLVMVCFNWSLSTPTYVNGVRRLVSGILWLHSCSEGGSSNVCVNYICQWTELTKYDCDNSRDFVHTLITSLLPHQRSCVFQVCSFLLSPFHTCALILSLLGFSPEELHVWIEQETKGWVILPP